MLALLLAACSVPPLQVTPQPRTELTEAPEEFPKVPEPSADAAEVSPGYRVEVVVKDLTYPSCVETDDHGNLYVAEAGYVYGDEAAPARVWRVARSGEMRVLTDKLNGPVTSLLWHKQRLFVSHRGKISVVNDTGSVRDLVTDLPSLGDHFNNQLAAGPDGKIYFGQGAVKGGVVKGSTKANGTILRLDPDSGKLEVYAWGLRNPYGLAWGADGKLYASDNGYDDRGSRPVANAPDVIWQVRQGAWYGWPDFVAGEPITDPKFQAPKKLAAKFLMQEHPPVEKPLLTLASQSAVTQLCTLVLFGLVHD